MKKIEKILLVICFIILNITIVSAKPFELDWRDSNSFIMEDSSDVFKNLKYRDGYLAIYNVETNSDLPDMYIRYYDKFGNTIKDNKLKNIGVIDAITNDDNVYLLVMIPGKYNYYYIPQIMKLDDNLSIEETYDLMDEDNYYYDDYLVGEVNYIAPKYGMTTLSIYNDNLYILGEKFKIRSFDLDLKKMKNVSSSANAVKKYFPAIYYLLKLTYDNNYDDYYDYYDYEEFFSDGHYNAYIAADVNDNYVAYSKNTCGMGGWLEYFIPVMQESVLETGNVRKISPITKISCSPSNYVGLLDKDGKTIWEKQNDKYDFIFDVKLINDYIVTIGEIYDEDYYVYYYDIVVYDLEGNVVQTIESKAEKGGYGFLGPTGDGFLVTDIDESNQCLKKSVAPTAQTSNIPACSIAATTEHYALPYNITIEVIGEGEVKANDKSYAEVKEKVETTPAEGYVLKSVVVTDEDGNVIEFKEDSFTMPTSDVKIVVTFVKKVNIPIIENPNTAAFSIIGVIVIAIGIGLVFKHNYKKLKFLK